MKWVLVLSSLLVGSALSWDFISKNCCRAHDHEQLGRICDDGQTAPITDCCGYGPCNVACCNCDNGCRSGSYAEYIQPGFPSAEITPNLGFSGASDPVKGNEFVWEAFQTATKDVVNGVAAFPGND